MWRISVISQDKGHIEYDIVAHSPVCRPSCLPGPCPPGPALPALPCIAAL